MGDKIVVPGTGVEVPLDLDLSRRDLLKIAADAAILDPRAPWGKLFDRIRF